MTNFHFHVNISDVAAKLSQTADLIEGPIKHGVEQLSVAAHGVILRHVNDTLSGFKLNAYLGKNNDNLRWSKVGDGMWVVELDDKADWLENGRETRFMDWLLKNAKTAKDGSKYRVIPMPIDQGAGKTPGFHSHKPAVADMAKKIMKDMNIPDLKTIERDQAGKPKVGVLYNVPKIETDYYADKANQTDFFSKPRSQEDSMKSGLKPHGGIFFLEGLMVMQRPNEKAKHGVTREAIVYRVISSKHQQEGRWFYPKVEPVGAFPLAAKWAEEQMAKMVTEIEKSFQNIHGG